MNGSATSGTLKLQVDHSGIIREVDEAARLAFGNGQALEGAPLADLVESGNGNSAEWTGTEGRFPAAVLAILNHHSDLIELELDRSVPAEKPPRRDDLLRVTTDVARADAGEIDRKIVESLERIGRMAGMDRAYVFLWTSNGEYAQNTHEWTREGVTPQITFLQQVPREHFGWFERALERDGHLVVRSLDDLDEEDDGREILESQGICSLVAFGMFDSGDLAGFVGFDSVHRETRWSRRSTERLTLIAELFIQSLLRARTEEELRRTSEVFDLIRIATSDVIWDWDLDSDHVRRSEALATLLGFEAGFDNSNSSWWTDRIHPDDRTHTSEVLESKSGDLLTAEYRIRHKDGHWVHVLDRGLVVRNAAGEPIRMVGMTTDISERIETMERLKESEARFRAVVENIVDVIAIVDREGTILYQSEAASGTYGYSPEELVGTNVFAPIHPDDRERVEALFRQAIENNAPREHATVRFRHAMGHWIVLDTVGVNLLDDETIGGIVLVSRDVTGRRRMEQQLERTNRLAVIGHLASAVAHEFNNVLMGAQPFLDVIERTDDPHKIQIATEKIGSALSRGKAISQSVLKLSRPVNIALGTVDLPSWFDSISDEIRHAFPDRTRVIVDLPKEPLPVIADPDALYESVFNFVLRAKDALRDQSSPAVRVEIRKASETDRRDVELPEPPDAYGVIVLHDNAPGFDEDQSRNLFNPKLQLTSSGEGLGLSAAHQMITAQKGLIGIASDETGTTVKIFLRRGLDEIEEPPDTSPSSDGETSHGRPRLLLVEDDEIVASGIVALLELEGQDVERVSTGTEAIESIAKDPPAIVILDIGLPDMSGVEVFEAVEAACPSLPVIFSTGHGDQSKLKSYLDRPNVEFLLKPYEASTLLALVDRLLER